MTLELSMVETIGFAVLLLTMGIWLRRKIEFFQRFAIPAAVIGGFSFAIVNLILRVTGVLTINFDTTLQSFFMTMFFTTVGFGASIAVLKQAGPLVLKFLAVCAGLVVAQNVVAVALAPVVRVPFGLALMTGSTPMVGGHGTAAGISPLVEAAGVTGAQTVAVTAATFGLVAGSLMGGPLANSLITKRDLLKDYDPKAHGFDTDLLSSGPKKLREARIIRAFMIILIAMLIGVNVSKLLNMGVSQFTDKAAFPEYLGCMFVAVFFRYISDKFSASEEREIVPQPEVEIIGNVALDLFLSMALMTVALWQLADLAIPMTILLIAQAILMFVFARYVTFNLMGKNYDAAVLTAGQCGFGMGATPNGMANMESIRDKFVDSKMAFFVLPLVGSMFIDFVNIIIITIFMGVFV